MFEEAGLKNAEDETAGRWSVVGLEMADHE
jgi:hypothetical protein